MGYNEERRSCRPSILIKNKKAMVQDQLVEYVSSQLKLGVSRDAVKSALTSVGWAPLDVEDTLKKVEGGVASAPAQPAAPQKTTAAAPGIATAAKPVSFSMPGNAAGQMSSPSSQSIRVSDLVSAVAPAQSMPAGSAAKTVPFGAPAGKPAMVAKDPIFKAPTIITSAPAGRTKTKFGIMGIVAVVLIVILGAFAGYLFMENSSLASQLQAASGKNQTVTQSSAAQIQALGASTTALEAQVASLTTENQDLSTDLALFVAPAGSTSSTAPVPISISGMLSAGSAKNTYLITTQYGAKASIKNSSDSGVAAAFQPLLGTTVQIGGTYVPGTPSITVTSVNGVPIPAPLVPVPAPATH
jgi:cell division protein FtsB